MARLDLGGANDVIGVIDLGGDEERVPIRSILWARRRSLGRTTWLWPPKPGLPTGDFGGT
jgi:hypothetical protein